MDRIKIEIITIGDELLFGHVVDTNASWISERLSEYGFKVSIRKTIGDIPEEMIEEFNKARKESDVVITTGGLGPTSDDHTRDVLCRVFDSGLIFNQQIYNNIESIFKSRNREVNQGNMDQAMVPEKCIPLANPLGTAPGMLFEDKNKIFVALPGVPHEMKSIFENKLIPFLVKKFSPGKIYHRFISTIGIGEPDLAEIIKEWENALPEGFSLAYLPSPGTVKLRLSVASSDPEIAVRLDNEVQKAKKWIGDYIYHFGDSPINLVVHNLLLSRKKTLIVAESCTGGYLSHLITSLAGCSEYFLGGEISYHNKVKLEIGVSNETLEKYGAVSRETVIEMAKGIRKKFNSDFSISISGIAGPTGGTAEKPVGLVWIAVGSSTGVIAEKYYFGDNRIFNIQKSAIYALNMLRKELIK